MTNDVIYTYPLFSPILLFFMGALLVPMLRGRIKSVVMLIIPVLSFWILHHIPEGNHWRIHFLDYELVLGRIDRLSRVFGYIFSIISFIAILFSIHVKDNLQHASGLLYAGSALGVNFAGDLISLYAFWELLAISPTFLILARRTRASQGAALRYILVHLFGGLSLLAGIVLYYQQAGTIYFSYIGLKGPATWLIFWGIALNIGIPPLHPWLTDAYPEATATGTVFLSVFTTKSAVSVMARTFPGTELLIWLGAFMTVIPIFYAVLENDLRRVLSYSMINQLGFMMVGIGIGTSLGINGAVSHAFCDILFKSLLFMAMGAVMHQTGRVRCTDLGGLYKTMPLTCFFCIIGAASISAFPLFSGFVSKSMVISAVGHHKLIAVWLMLQFASAGVFHHAGIKIPFFTFFGHDAGIRTTEPPRNMLIAMGIAAFLCVYIGTHPKPLYNMLPYPVSYEPYTAAHVMAQLQLLMFGALAFCMLILSGIYPAEIRSINLDTDWFYRKGGAFFYRLMDRGLNSLNQACDKRIAKQLTPTIIEIALHFPSRLAYTAAASIHRIGSWKTPFIDKTRFNTAFDVGALPVGIGVALAAFFMVLLFFLL